MRVFPNLSVNETHQVIEAFVNSLILFDIKILILFIEREEFIIRNNESNNYGVEDRLTIYYSNVLQKISE